MEKLQLYISQSLRGYKNLLKINETHDIYSQIHDFRSALDEIDYDSSRSNIFYLVKYLEAGLLISVLRTIPHSAKGDHLAASVFVPNGIKLSTIESLALSSIISVAIDTDGRELQQDNITVLNDHFKKAYPTDTNTPARLPSVGKTYAYAYYGGNYPSLKQFADVGFYQPEYSDYAGVLLIDSIYGVKGAPGSKNLSRKTLTEIITLIPPTLKPGSFSPYINHQPFRLPVLVPARSSVNILWRQPGFEPVTQTIDVQNENPTYVSAPNLDQAHKIISPGMFYITEYGSQRIIGAFMIKVNGKEIDGPVSFAYSDLTHAKVEISSPGYLPYTGELDLASSSQALVQMHTLHHTYRFELPVHTSDAIDSVRIYLKSKKTITESPIEGYSVTGGHIHEGSGISNRLIYTGGYTRGALVRLIIGVVLGILIGFAAAWLLKPDQHHTIHQSSQNTTTVISEDVMVSDHATAELPTDNQELPN